MTNFNTPPSAHTAVYKPQQITVCGIIGIVFGALGFILSFIPIINNIAAILGFAGIILALVGIVGTFRGKKSGKAVAVLAAILSILAIVITLAMQSAASKAIDNALGQSTTEQNTTNGKDSDSDASNKKSSQDAKGEQDMEGDLNNLHVKIISAVKSSNDYNGKPTVFVTYEWKNNTDRNNSFAALAHPQVFQNGQSLDTAMYMEQPEGYDARSYVAEVQPGATGTVTLGYVLNDDSAITVDVTDLISINGNAKITHTFNLQ